jgi:hypothetical protein
MFPVFLIYRASNVVFLLFFPHHFLRILHSISLRISTLDSYDSQFGICLYSRMYVL